MKTALLALAALLGIAIGTATLTPASATMINYSENSGGGAG